jgi:hypothetical protein
MDGSGVSSAWSTVVLGLTGYFALCRLLRYHARDRKAAQYPYKTKDDFKNMTTKHAWEIQRWLYYTEFPFTAEKALQFALFRTYAIPSVSKLLVKTKLFATTQLAPKVTISLMQSNSPLTNCLALHRHSGVNRGIHWEFSRF